MLAVMPLHVRESHYTLTDVPCTFMVMVTFLMSLRANERAILDEVTLNHIVTGELPERVRELINDPRAWA